MDSRTGCRSGPGGAGYWRGIQQARLVAQTTLATRQAECEARQRQQAQGRPHNRRWKPP
ncbi:MAG: hypothetical protein ACR5LG_14425 [Sodalis sp. (in: enterobacteria)]